MYENEPVYRCYICDEPGHFARNCRNKNRRQAPVTEPGPWPPPPPQFDPSGTAKADARAWGDRIRAKMGWTREATIEQRRVATEQELARLQVEESRKEREAV